MTRVAPLPFARSDVAAARVNGKIYVFGGCLGSGHILRAVDVYSPATNQWSTAPRNLPEPRTAMYQVAVLEPDGVAAKVYVIGGWDGTGIGERTVYVYDVVRNRWTQAPRMPTRRAEMGVATFRNKIYAVGGAQPAFGSPGDANEVFTP